MAVDPTYLIFSIGVLICIGYFLHRLFLETGIPDLLFLILIGIAAGSSASYLSG
ncbi:MAG: hypothetical protein JXA44_02305 [Methanospirillaceae archaeon]|nr:hypothetical protein [Methanospirillaceae archaeon]